MQLRDNRSQTGGQQMWSILREAFTTSWDQKRDAFKCFWFCIAVAILFMVAFLIWVIWSAPDGRSPQFWLMAVAWFIVFLVVGMTPAAVKWHRLIVAAEKISWRPEMPSKTSLTYAGIFVGITVLQAFFAALCETVWSWVVLPFFGLATAEANSGFLYWVELAEKFGLRMYGRRFAEAVGISGAEAMVVGLFTLLVSPLLLRLPEISLNADMRGARNRWPIGGRSSFVGALAVLAFLQSLVHYLIYNLRLEVSVRFSLDSNSLEIIQGSMTLLLSLALALVGLTLLSVAYRRNLALP